MLFAGGLRWARRRYRDSPVAVEAVAALRRNRLARAVWMIARRIALVRWFVETLRGGRPRPVVPPPTIITGGSYTPPHGLLPWFNPLNIQVSAALSGQPCLNVVLPSLSRKHLSGGPNTALNVAYRLAALGIPIRLISSDVAFDDHEALWVHLTDLTGMGRLRNVSVADASDRGKPLEIGENDVFMATAWWTAQMAKYAIRYTRHTRFVYLIQDYEPLLHAASTQQALAEETYRLDFIPILNSSLLAEFFFSSGIGRFAAPECQARTLVFEPAVDQSRFFPAPSTDPAPGAPKAEPRRKLLFYARPTGGLRNLFELGVAALQKVIADGALSPDHWDIIGIGENFEPIALGRGAMLVAEPWHDLDGYAALLRHSDVLLSLMMSPHPSYPPLEMAACGHPVVTSAHANKTSGRLAVISKHIIATEPTIEAIADGLLVAIEQAETDSPAESLGHIGLPSTWDESLSPILPRLHRSLVDLFDGPRATGQDMRTAIEFVHFEGYQNWPVSRYELQRIESWRDRRRRYRDPQPGLISFLTTVWNTDPRYVEALAETVFFQDSGSGFEWILMDNGSSRGDTMELLERLAKHPSVRYFRVEQNLGIIGGLRRCLELAKNRYIVPLDSDDLLTPDCIRVLTSALGAAGYPALAYTDEDKVDETGFRDAYIKPDPVLFVHSCYIAHLCAIDRELALELDAYGDPEPMGSHDWDSFV
jgi:O-antigen biosynthesis protein